MLHGKARIRIERRERNIVREPSKVTYSTALKEALFCNDTTTLLQRMKLSYLLLSTQDLHCLSNTHETRVFVCSLLKTYVRTNKSPGTNA